MDIHIWGYVNYAATWLQKKKSKKACKRFFFYLFRYQVFSDSVAFTQVFQSKKYMQKNNLGHNHTMPHEIVLGIHNDL